jgi:sortase A
VPRKKSLEDLSVEELRRLIVEKRRADRQERLERFRKTGRAISLTSEFDSPRIDDLRTESPDEPEGVSSKSGVRRILDGFLFLVEILAVVGLVLVIFNGLEVIRELNQEVADALEQPTLTPTPLIVAVVLPSGHTPPNSPGGAQPNEAEIPEHLRPLVQSLAQIPIPTQGPNQASRVQIPAIDVDAPVVQGDGWEQLKKGVGQHIGTSNPGQDGNVVLSAHNDIFGEIFRDLDLLNPGDLIALHSSQQVYNYVVVESMVVEPTRVDVMDQTDDPEITLISCYPYLVDNKRIVVRGVLQSGN